MNSRPLSYTQEELVGALRAVGVREGDTLLTHSSVGMLGLPEGCSTKEEVAEVFLSAFRSAIGDDGVWLLPAYTYSLTTGEVFDPAETPPGLMGLLSEVLWRHPDARRSLDPIFSVIAFGTRSHDLIDDIPHDCFGADSVYARLLEADGAVCNVGIGAHSALIHHVEQMRGVPYRFPKVFTGRVRVGGVERDEAWNYHVRDLDQPRDEPYFLRLDRDGRADGSTVAAEVGRGEINLVRARDLERLIVEGLAHDPEYLVLGELAGLPIG